MKNFKFVPLIGRVMIGLPFLLSGISKVSAYAGTIAYIESVGLPAAKLAYVLAVVTEICGSVLLIAGYQTRLVSMVLALFSLATALFFHNHFADLNQMTHFLKNVMIAGGLLQITYFGAGAFSVDARALREVQRTTLRTN